MNQLRNYPMPVEQPWIIRIIEQHGLKLMAQEMSGVHFYVIYTVTHCGVTGAIYSEATHALTTGNGYMVSFP